MNLWKGTWIRRRFRNLAFVLPAVVLAGVAWASTATADHHIRELVLFDETQFPEGLSVAQDGTIHVGIFTTGQVITVTPNGTASQLGQVPVPADGYFVGLASVDAANVYGLVFSPTDTSNGVWYVSQQGVHQIAELPLGSFPNDLVRDEAGQLYVTDVVGGRVYRVQPTGEVELWAHDPLLLGNVEEIGPLGFPLGANGIAFAPGGDAVYVAVTEGARIVRFPIEADGSAGAMTVVAEDPALAGADGLAVDSSGTIYVSANAQNHIARVDPATGAVEVVASGSIFRFPAVLRFSPDERTLYVTNYDALVALGLAPGPARTGLLAIDVAALGPQPAAITPPGTGDGGLADTRGDDPGIAWPVIAAAIALSILFAARAGRLRARR
jgi:sugar lactone lactonase YvrE